MTALAFGCLLPLDSLGAVVAVAFVASLGIKASAAALTTLVIVAADQLPIQFLVERKYSVLEMVAEDVILGNQLHASVRFSIVEQQTVAVHTVAALPPDQATDLPKLSCFNFNENLTSFPVTPNKFENTVGNIITLLRMFRRSGGA